MNIRRVFTVVAVLQAALCSRAELILKGVTITDGAPWFSIYSVEDKTSKWVSLGQSFTGFKVVEYDPEKEVLTLAKGDLRESIRLQGAWVKASSAAEANTRLRTLTGVDLAYELAKEGDSEMANMLKIYQELLKAIADLSPPAVIYGSKDPEKLMKSLVSSAESMRVRLEKGAAERAALFLAAPVSH